MNRLVVALDVAVLLGAARLFLRPLGGVAAPLDAPQALLIAALAAVGLVFGLTLIGGYRVERYRQPARALIDLLACYGPAALAGGAALRIFLADHAGDLSWSLRWAGLILVMMLYARLLACSLFSFAERGGALRRHVAIIGAGPLAEAVRVAVTAPERGRDYAFVGLYPHFGGGADRDGGAIDQLLRHAQTHRVDTIVIALPWSQAEDILKAAEHLQWISADILAPFSHPGFRLRDASMTQVGGVPAVRLSVHPFKGVQSLLKLAQDYGIGAIAALIATPLLLAAAVAIRLDSPGPALSRQRRIGLNGKVFQAYTLRTQRVDPTEDDARPPTRLGAVLRRTRIAQLPQLINVLRGEMSIVGPRPHAPSRRVGEARRVDAVRDYAARHHLKPGITGWAQINGLRGGLTGPEREERSAELDLGYVKNWSLRLDLQIMVRTLLAVMAGPDAP